MRVRFLICFLMMLAGVAKADTTVSDADGVLTWTPEKPGSHVEGKFKPTRWGMYDVTPQLESPAAGKIKITFDGKEPASGRIYLDTANERTVVVEAPAVVKSVTLTPAPEGKPIVQSDDLSITLHAHDATVHGVNLRYEFRPDKNTLGYWSNPKDWVSWDFEVKKPGKFNVVVMHGSPGTKEIEIAVGDQKIDWTTTKTGSFHTFTFLQVGTLTFDKPGVVTLTLKPAKTVTGSVMDLRHVILLPILK